MLKIKNKSLKGKKINNLKNKEKFSKNKSIDARILFCIKFFIIFFLLSFIIDRADLSFVNNYLAFLVASIMSLPYQGNIIFSGKNFLITNMCTGLTTVSILAATIFSMRKPLLKNKLILFLVGSILIFLINIPRIMLVIYSEIFGFDSEIVHTFTWFIMSGVVLLIILFGLKFYYKKDLISIL